MTTLPEPKTYSVAEVAALLGYPKSTLHQHIREGKANELRPIRTGNVTKFSKAYIDRLLEEGAA